MSIPFLDKLRSKNISIVTRATISFLVCSIIQKTMSLLTIPIFSRIMTEEQMGEFTAYTAWLQIFTIITTLRLDYGVFNKGMSKFENDREGYASSMLGTTSTLTVGCFIIYLIFHKSINAFTELSTLVTCMIFLELLVVPAIQFWSLFQRYLYKYKSVIALTLAMTFCHTLIGILVVWVSEDKSNARILTNALIQVIFGLFAYGLCIRNSRKFFNWEYIKYAVTFNIPLLPHYFSTYVLEQSDKVMIQKMVGNAELGIYGIACSIAQVIKIVTSSITNALLPWQYEALRQKRHKEVGQRIIAVVLVVELAILIFISCAPEIMLIMAPRSYYEAIYVIPPISSGVFIVLYFGLVVNAEFYFEKNKFVMYVSCFAAVINILINYIGIKNWGYLAAAYATFICYLISGMCHTIYANHLTVKSTGERLVNPWYYVGIAGTAILTVIVMSILYNHIIIRYLLIVVVLGICAWKRKSIIRLFKFGID